MQRKTGQGRIDIVGVRKTLGFLLALLLLITVSFVTGRFGAIDNDPDKNCHTSAVTDVWSSTRSYEAILLKKNCNEDESIFYTVRLNFFAPTAGPLGDRSSFAIHDLENDDYPDTKPELYWENSRTLVAVVKTRELAGTLTLRQQGATFVRKYVTSAKERDSPSAP